VTEPALDSAKMCLPADESVLTLMFTEPADVSASTSYTSSGTLRSTFPALVLAESDLKGCSQVRVLIERSLV
jgi:hypothetical protein